MKREVKRRKNAFADKYMVYYPALTGLQKSYTFVNDDLLVLIDRVLRCAVYDGLLEHDVLAQLGPPRVSRQKAENR